MKNVDETNFESDEIDFNLILKKIFYVIQYPVNVLVSNFKTTLFFILLSVISGYVIKNTLPKTFSASFIIQPLDNTDKLYIKILLDLPKLIKQKEINVLAKELKLDKSYVANLTNIEFKNDAFKKNTDTLYYTEIFIETTNNKQILEVQNAIINYLENNPYYLKIKKLQEIQMELTLNQLNKDLKDLDSLKKIQLNYFNSNKNVLQTSIPINDLINPTATYTMVIDRIEKKSSIIAQRVFIDRFQLIKSCKETNYVVSPPRILFMLLYLVPLFLILCFVFLEIKHKIFFGDKNLK